MLKGKITIGRYSSNGDRDRQCYIDIIDTISGAKFLRLEIAPEQLALALTGLSDCDCEFDLHPAVVGKKRESKTIYIECAIDRSHDEIVDVLRDESRQYEVDGWKCALNPNARFDWDRDGTWAKIAVPFVRYVEV